MESKSRKYSMEINKRFFQALEALMLQGKVVSLTNFCETYGLYRIKYQRLKVMVNQPAKQTDYKNIDTAAIGYLVKDFGISADWILIGEGFMFRNDETEKSRVLSSQQ